MTWTFQLLLHSLAGHWPLTCCSRLSMTATAWWRMSSLVWGFSLFRCSWHMRPSSLKASLMSRTLRRSRALLALLLSRSRSAFCSGFRSSSSVILWETIEIHLDSDLFYNPMDETKGKLKSIQPTEFTFLSDWKRNMYMNLQRWMSLTGSCSSLILAFCSVTSFEKIKVNCWNKITGSIL